MNNELQKLLEEREKLLKQKEQNIEKINEINKKIEAYQEKIEQYSITAFFNIRDIEEYNKILGLKQNTRRLKLFNMFGIPTSNEEKTIRKLERQNERLGKARQNYQTEIETCENEKKYLQRQNNRISRRISIIDEGLENAGIEISEENNPNQIESTQTRRTK